MEVFVKTTLLLLIMSGLKKMSIHFVDAQNAWLEVSQWDLWD